MKKFKVALLLVGITSVLVVSTVIAGGTLDYGTLANNPPQANWTAWLTSDLVSGTSIPNEIITEDNYNQGLGEDLGYQFDGSSTYYWLTQVENLTQASDGDQVNMIFGTIGNYAGDLYYYDFNWNSSTNPDIDPTGHGIIPVSQQGYCPAIEVTPTASGYSIVAWGTPGQLYYIYRSQNSSDANNGASNGRYFYLDSITMEPSGYVNYSDETTLQSWYLVIAAGSDGIGFGGCHSEFVGPLAAVLSDFTSSFNPDTASVELSWETFSDSDILGFDIYRSDEYSPVLVKINNETLLVEEPGGTEGNQYSYTDAGVQFGQTYTYWLDLIDLEGQTSRFGPVTQFAGFKVFVPIMQK